MRISNLNLLLTVIFSFFIDFYIREHNAILRLLSKKINSINCLKNKFVIVVSYSYGSLLGNHKIFLVESCKQAV